MTKPSWRQIETALIEVLLDYGITVEEVHGDRFVSLRQGNSPPVEYSIEKLARELEERL